MRAQDFGAAPAPARGRRIRRPRSPRRRAQLLLGRALCVQTEHETLTRVHVSSPRGADKSRRRRAQTIRRSNPGREAMRTIPVIAVVAALALAACSKGPEGPQGPQGVAGPQGAKGEVG